MYNLIDRIKKSIRDIENEKGAFQIKCLVAQNPDDMVWDLVLAADWFDSDEYKRIEYLTNKIMPNFTNDIISQFSGIITIDINSELGKILERIQNNYNSGKYNLFVDDYLVVNTEYKFPKMVVPLTEYRSKLIEK
jgi:hypothetical protein